MPNGLMLSCMSEMQNTSKPEIPFNMPPNLKDSLLAGSMPMPANFSNDGSVSAQQLMMHQMVAWFQGVQAALSLMPSLIQKPLLETQQMLASQLAAQSFSQFSNQLPNSPCMMLNGLSGLPFQSMLDNLQQTLPGSMKDSLNLQMPFKPAFNIAEKQCSNIPDEPLELCKKPRIDSIRVSSNLTAFKEPKSQNSSVQNNQSVSGNSIARGSSSDMDSSLSAGDDDYLDTKPNDDGDKLDKCRESVPIDENDLSLFYDHLRNRKRQLDSENDNCDGSLDGVDCTSPQLKMKRGNYDHGYVSEKHKLRAKRDGSANSRRIKANARERSRVHTISAAFDSLRTSVPVVSDHQKLSKLAVLRIASCYIETLAAFLEDDNKRTGDLPQDLSLKTVDGCVASKRPHVPRYKPDLTFNDCVKQLKETILMESKIKRS